MEVPAVLAVAVGPLGEAVDTRTVTMGILGLLVEVVMVMGVVVDTTTVRTTVLLV
ncbi:hypothetical protein [Thalassobacillus pellis]|uniref:hypothetical protein n=1 Tax=Thalassobacillus pellis TaxID=748008 RepID=UPI001960533D|nr:hypothetical protein [Thalassobacillus pellis]MBM7554536.1 hypothetical protein [Thalassobacillus pellis]